MKSAPPTVPRPIAKAAPARGRGLAGLIAAPFTPLLPDTRVNWDLIPAMADWLVRHWITAAFIGGTLRSCFAATAANPEPPSMSFHRRLLIAPLFAALTALHAAEITVAPGGDDHAAGTRAAPLRSIQTAFARAAAGDTILLRTGIYREAVALHGKSGREGAPITLQAYPGEKPVISGLDVLNLEWTATTQPGVYSAPLDAEAIAQLFFNGKPLLEARWPNVPRDASGDWNFFAPEVWASADPTGNAYGTLASAELARTGWDVTGAQALLNVDHQFFCWTRQVRTHAAGAATFTYDQDLGQSVNKRDESGALGKWNKGNKFYLFGKREFLDAPGEWFFDAAAKRLYLVSADGKSPATGTLELKTRHWAFQTDAACNSLTIDGVGFFGTAFKLGENPSHRGHHLALRNCTVLYSSWTEYLATRRARAGTDPDQRHARRQLSHHHGRRLGGGELHLCLRLPDGVVDERTEQPDRE